MEILNETAQGLGELRERGEEGREGLDAEWHHFVWCPWTSD